MCMIVAGAPCRREDFKECHESEKTSHCLAGPGAYCGNVAGCLDCAARRYTGRVAAGRTTTCTFGQYTQPAVISNIGINDATPPLQQKRVVFMEEMRPGEFFTRPFLISGDATLSVRAVTQMTIRSYVQYSPITAMVAEPVTTTT